MKNPKKYELSIHIKNVIDYEILGVMAKNKEEAAEKFYEKLPEEMTDWIPSILKHYIHQEGIL